MATGKQLRHETFTVGGRWLKDHIITLARWKVNLTYMLEKSFKSVWIKRKLVVNCTKRDTANVVPALSHCHQYQQVTNRRHSLVMTRDADACAEHHQRQAMTSTAAADAAECDDDDVDLAEVDLHHLSVGRRLICRWTQKQNAICYWRLQSRRQPLTSRRRKPAYTQWINTSIIQKT